MPLLLPKPLLPPPRTPKPPFSLQDSSSWPYIYIVYRAKHFQPFLGRMWCLYAGVFTYIRQECISPYTLTLSLYNLVEGQQINLCNRLPDLAYYPVSLALALPSHVSDMVEMTYGLRSSGSTFMYLYHLISIDLQLSRLLNSPTLHCYNLASSAAALYQAYDHSYYTIRLTVTLAVTALIINSLTILVSALYKTGVIIYLRRLTVACPQQGEGGLGR